MRREMIFCAVVLSLLLGSSCQYAHARLRDAADCIAGSVTVGPGFMVSGQATWLTFAGGGYFEGERYALYYGEFTSDRIYFGGLGLGPLFSTQGVSGENSILDGWFSMFGVPLFGGCGVAVLNPLLSFEEQFAKRGEAVESRIHCGCGLMDVGFNLHLGYLGIEFRIKLAEIIDFVLGLVTIDIPGDDIRTYGPPPKEQEPDEERPEEQRPFSLPG